MAFCTSCGGNFADGARFCTRCGSPQSVASQPGVPPPPASFLPPLPQQGYSPAALDYTIQGNNLQVARLHLKPNQEVYGEAGRMVYKTGNVYWDTRMTGGTLGEKLMGALRRKLTGESLFFTYFRSSGPGEVGFAGAYPGKVEPFTLAPGQSIVAQRDTFLCAQTSVTFGIAFVRRLGAGLFGGEGLFLANMTGPGKVIVQSMTLSKMRRELATGLHGHDERGGVGGSAIGSIADLFGGNNG